VANVRRLGHLVVDGLRGLVISPGQTLACVTSLAVAACLLTLFVAFGSLVGLVLDRAGQRARLLVYLKDEVNSAEVEALVQRIHSRPEVEGVEYVSREQDRKRNEALLPQDLLARLGPDAIPGQHCLDISLRPSRTLDVEAITALLRGIEGVDAVAEPPVGAARLRSVAAAVRFARVVLTAAAILLFASTVFFVVGTLMRTLERRREEMAILKLLGATDAFVRIPLYVQGVVQGVVGVMSGAIAALIVIGATNAWLSVDLLVGIRVPVHPVATMFAALFLGAGVGATGAFIACLRGL